MPDSGGPWEELLAVTRDQVAAAEAGNWGRVRALMAARRAPGTLCPAHLADEYWGAHQTLRELLGARLIALEAELGRLARAAHPPRPLVAPVLVDRRE